MTTLVAAEMFAELLDTADPKDRIKDRVKDTNNVLKQDSKTNRVLNTEFGVVSFKNQS